MPVLDMFRTNCYEQSLVVIRRSWWADGRTDGRTLPSTLSPYFAVDKNRSTVIFRSYSIICHGKCPRFFEVFLYTNSLENWGLFVHVMFCNWGDSLLNMQTNWERRTSDAERCLSPTDMCTDSNLLWLEWGISPTQVWDRLILQSWMNEMLQLCSSSATFIVKSCDRVCHCSYREDE